MSAEGIGAIVFLVFFSIGGWWINRDEDRE